MDRVLDVPFADVIIVDDDPEVIEQLRTDLAHLDGAWTLRFCGSRDEAIAALTVSAPDVVVSGVTSERDEQDILDVVRVSIPSVGRIRLSDDGIDDAFRSVRSAHRVLDRPCRRGELAAAIEMIVRNRRQAPTDAIRDIVGAVDHLPSPGPIHHQLLQALEEDQGLDVLSEIVTQDVALTAEMLRLVNSSSFGLARTLSSVVDAISFLGVDVMTAMVAARSLFERTDGLAIDVDEVNRHSRGVASLAARSIVLAGEPSSMRSDAYVAGLLHDVGTLVLGQMENVDGDEVRRILSLDDALTERMEFGADRFSVGEHLLGLWGFGESVAAAVRELGEAIEDVEIGSAGWHVRVAHSTVLRGDVTPDAAMNDDDPDVGSAIETVDAELRELVSATTALGLASATS
ncbi:MAG: HDOD domain-containing protein [Actinomycetota bacterium]